MGRRGSAQYLAGEQIEAFRERATRIRQHPLFQNPDYSFNFHVRPHPGGTGWAIAMPRANQDQQVQFASLIRPLLAPDDMIFLPKVFNTFATVCTSGLLKQAMVDLRQDHKARETSTLFSRTPTWRKGETPPAAFVPDTQLAKAVLYGKVLHTDPDHRRWLATFGGPGQARPSTRRSCACSTTPAGPRSRLTRSSASPSTATHSHSDLRVKYTDLPGMVARAAC